MKLRKRFVVGCTAVFVAVWIGIFGQLISGHDPALAAQSTRGSASSSQAANPSSAGSSTSSSTSSSASPVTTRQS